MKMTTTTTKRQQIFKYLRMVGPGWMSSIAFLDPGNLESDLQTGAGFGYQLLWIVWWSTVIGCTLQILSVYLGLYGGMDLAEACNTAYPFWFSRFFWILSEICAMASDLLDVIGFAFACMILFGIPLYAGVILSLCSTIVVASTEVIDKRYLEYIVMLLVFFMSFCFFIELSFSGMNGIALLKGWAIPWINGSSILIAVSQIGSIVMPHNLFLQSSLSKKYRSNLSENELRKTFIFMSMETAIPIAWSFFLNAAVITLASETFPTAQLHGYGIPAPNIGLNDVCNLIQHIFPHSNAGCILWGLALFCSGLSASVTSTYAGNAILQGFWNVNVRIWLRGLIGRILSVIPAVIITVIVGEAGANTSIIIASSLLSVVLPIIMLPLIQLTASKRFMGGYRISFWIMSLFYFELLLVFVANLYLLITLNTSGIIGGVIFSIAFILISIYIFSTKIKETSRTYEIDPTIKRPPIEMPSIDEDKRHHSDMFGVELP